jgi:hypothetical protein
MSTRSIIRRIINRRRVKGGVMGELLGDCDTEFNLESALDEIAALRAEVERLSLLEKDRAEWRQVAMANLEKVEALRSRVEVLTKALESSCDEQREMLWEASGVGHGCKRAIDAEAEVDRLQKAVEWALTTDQTHQWKAELRRRAKEG